MSEIRSIDGKWIYTVIRNPLKNIVKMKSENNCSGCSHMANVYDDKAHDFRPYCLLFDVWNDYSGDAFSANAKIFPNMICKIHIRETESMPEMN